MLMLIALGAMWLSSITYWIFSLIFAAKTNAGLQAFVSQNAYLMSSVQECASALADSGNSSTYCQPTEQVLNQYSWWSPYNNEAEAAYWNRGCAGSAALTVNV